MLGGRPVEIVQCDSPASVYTPYRNELTLHFQPSASQVGSGPGKTPPCPRVQACAFREHDFSYPPMVFHLPAPKPAYCCDTMLLTGRAATRPALYPSPTSHPPRERRSLVQSRRLPLAQRLCCRPFQAAQTARYSSPFIWHLAAQPRALVPSQVASLRQPAGQVVPVPTRRAQGTPGQASPDTPLPRGIQCLFVSRQNLQWPSSNGKQQTLLLFHTPGAPPSCHIMCLASTWWCSGRLLHSFVSCHCALRFNSTMLRCSMARSDGT